MQEFFPPGWDPAAFMRRPVPRLVFRSSLIIAAVAPAPLLPTAELRAIGILRGVLHLYCLRWSFRMRQFLEKSIY